MNCPRGGARSWGAERFCTGCGLDRGAGPGGVIAVDLRPLRPHPNPRRH